MQWNDPPPASPQAKSPRKSTPTTLRPGKTRLQGFERRFLRRRAVDRHHDDAVSDDEVHVRGGRDVARRVAIQPDARDAHDIEPTAHRVRRRLEGAGDLLERRRIGVVGAAGRLAHDAPRCHETGDVVDVAVGVVVLETFRDPDDGPGAERFTERPLGLGLRPAVAVGIEQRLARRQDRAFAVVVDRSAFQDEAEAAHRHARQARNVAADGCVVGQLVLAAPAVGLEAQRNWAARTARKDRPRVAQPDVAVARGHELGGVAEGRTRATLRLRPVDQKPNPVCGGQRERKRRHVAARRCEVAVPFARVGGPSRPDGLLRGPLRRDADSELGHVQSLHLFAASRRPTSCRQHTSRATAVENQWRQLEPRRGLACNRLSLAASSVPIEKR